MYVGAFTLGRSKVELWVRAGEVELAGTTAGSSGISLRIVTPTATATLMGRRSSFAAMYDQIARTSTISARRGAVNVEPTTGRFDDPRPSGPAPVSLGAGREVQVGVRMVSRVAAT